jgi:Uma2 family endonuclease
MTALDPINVPHAAKLRAADFMVLLEAGAFSEHAKAELIEGEIWVMNAVYSRHAKAMARFPGALLDGLDKAGLNLEVFSDLSVAMPDDSMPQPDIVIAEDNDGGPLALEKVRLVIEISDSTLDIDLGRKAAVYARHLVPEYWVIDLDGAQIFRHSGAIASGYESRDTVKFGMPIEAKTLPGLVVETKRLSARLR